MTPSLEDFISQVPDFDELHATEKCDYFVYFLTEIKKQPEIRAKDVEACFTELRIPKYSKIRDYLSRRSRREKDRIQKYIKVGDTYHLQRKRAEEIRSSIITDIPTIHVNKTLRSLLPHVNSMEEKEFLDEAIKCFEVEAFRAALIMVWLLTLDHLYEYILTHKLPEFNTELAKVTDRRVKVAVVRTKDDFGDIPEGKFIELCRMSGVISNDIRKILDHKLGVRNSAAHPSTVKVTSGKAFEFVEDLVHNVILKY